MDSRQGGCDGVTTDGILTPALPTGIVHSIWVERMWLETNKGTRWTEKPR